MKLSDAILAGITGTSAFTLFSYIVAERTGRSYKQPGLIGKMINRTRLDLNKKEAAFAGWLTHYFIGIAFATVYRQIIDITHIKPGIKNGAIAGAISGIPATLTWHTSLEVHPVPPRKKAGIIILNWLRDILYLEQLVSGYLKKEVEITRVYPPVPGMAVNIFHAKYKAYSFLLLENNKGEAPKWLILPHAKLQRKAERQEPVMNG